MIVHTIISQLTETTHHKDKNNNSHHGWQHNPYVDEELNLFLLQYGERVIRIDSHIQTIRTHNNGGFDTLLKITTITLKGE
jgi:hypothetical protein